jgi:hypothetical protein
MFGRCVALAVPSASAAIELFPFLKRAGLWQDGQTGIPRLGYFGPEASFSASKVVTRVILGTTRRADFSLK